MRLFDKGFDPLAEIQKTADSAGKAIGDAAGSIGKTIGDVANAADSAAVDIAEKASLVAGGTAKSIQEGASSALENAGTQIKQIKEDQESRKRTSRRLGPYSPSQT